MKQPEFELPPEAEYTQPSIEERMEHFGDLLREARKGVQWEPILTELLWAFEKFLTEKPEPPKAWSERLGADASRYDYHQLVLPGDYTDPYKDDLENVQLLREKFQGQQSFMALENTLVTRNHFLFGSGHVAPVCLPRPLVMFESAPSSPQVDWDCYLTVYPDGSWQAYNLDRDDEETIGEDIAEHLERWMPIVRFLRVIVPAEGRDFGWFKEGDIEEEA